MTSSQLLVLLGVAFAVWAAAAALHGAPVPTAVLLVIAGVVVGFLPFVPDASLDPRLALEGFLPPLVFYAAYWTSPRSIFDDRVQIGLLAIGLVGLTTGAVAVAAHSIGGLSWPMSLVLGAAVGPTDTVAATSISTKLSLPARLTSLMQNEAMFNDATALVLYAAAVTAATTGHFSAGKTIVSIVYASLVGAAIGLGVAFVGERLRRRVNDPALVIVLSVLVAYGAYWPAQGLRASGVIAAVTAGLYLGWHQPSSVSAESRLQSRGFWDTAEFLLNASLFVLVGLSLHSFTVAARGPVGRLALTGLVVVTVVIAVRLTWTAIMAVTSRLLTRSRGSARSWREYLLLGWSGMRGGVTLAAVVAIPTATTTGLALAGRDDVIYLAFAVIFVTLVGQGLTLPLLARRLRPDISPDYLDQDRRARAEILGSARRLLDDKIAAGVLSPQLTETVRSLYESRLRRLQPVPPPTHADHLPAVTGLALQQELIAAQRQRLIELRAQGEVSSTAFRAIQHDLDLDEQRLSSEAAARDSTRLL